MTTIRIYFLSFLFLFGCSEQEKDIEISINDISTEIASPITYAKGFTIVVENNVKKIHVLNPFSSYRTEQTIVLLQKGQSYIAQENETIVEVPLKTIAPFSTTFYSPIAALGCTNTIVAIAAVNYVFSSEITDRYANGKIAQVGDGAQLNIEKIVLLYPDAVVVNGYQGGLDKSFIKIREAGIPVVINYDWKEATPLARAEWIKFFGALYNEYEKADSIFNQIETNYNQYKTALDKVTKRPNVLFSSAYQGTWYIPGGKSYVAQFLKDAKGTYPWISDTTTGSLPLSMETIAFKLLDADVWLASESSSLENLLQKDVRYGEFAPFKKGLVYEHDKKRTKSGGNDFWETGALRVDLILKDYINILHPGVLDDQSLTFFRKLESF